jgi:CPA1 family monovalent cation:H+ antiporter
LTLVFQGLTLPWLIRKLNPTDNSPSIPEYDQEITIQKKIAKYSLQFLEEKYSNDTRLNEHLNNLHARLKIDLVFFDREIEEIKISKENSLRSFQGIYLEMLEQQRSLLNKMNSKSEFDEDLIRKYLFLIDLEEFKIREKLLQEVDPK